MQKNKNTQKSNGGFKSSLLLIVGFIVGLIVMSLLLVMLSAILPV